MRVKKCRYPGCMKKATNGNYCDEHQEEGNALTAERKKGIDLYEKQRAVERLNGLTKTVLSELHNTKRWQNLAKAVKIVSPFCSKCGSTERLEVHHIVKPYDEQSFFNESNLVVLCHQCHAKENARQARGGNG